MNKSDPADSLEWTGERLVTSCNRPLVYEHLHRYAIACTLAAGRRVLDLACGEGYGSNLLARVASSVLGVDIDAKTIAHAKAKYPHRNLEFLEGSCAEIPCADASIDLVASFETIEHIDDHGRFLAELKRVLIPGGLLIISSPDKAEYRRRGEAGNPFHQAELSHDEFLALMRANFKHCVAGRQRLVAGSWIAPDVASTKVAAATFQGDFTGIEMQPGVHHGIYSIAVCSDRPLPAVHLGLFEDPRVSADIWSLLDRTASPAELFMQFAENENAARILKERNEHIAILQQEVEQRTRQVAESRQAFEEKVKHLAIVQAELDARSRHIAILQRDTEEARGKVVESAAAFEEKVRHVEILQQDVEGAKRQVAESARAFEEKVRHVQILQREADLKTTQVEHFKKEAEQQAQRNEQLKRDLDRAESRLARVSNELMDARWEALTTRAATLRNGDPVENQATVILELENRAHIAESEADHLRNMLKAVQADLEEQQAAREAKEAKLKLATKELRFHQKQMARLKEITSRKLILPFGKAQRRIQQITTASRSDD